MLWHYNNKQSTLEEGSLTTLDRVMNDIFRIGLWLGLEHEMFDYANNKRPTHFGSAL